MGHEAGEESAEAVAIIGMSCRVPGARDIEEFWHNLVNGVESIVEFPEQDLIGAGYDPALLKQPGYVNRRGVIPDPDLFDADFFGFNPREADILDPQQRVFLECAWEALESAGYDADKYRGLIAIYAGCGMSRYIFQILSNPTVANTIGSYQIGLANDKDHITTRVSYKLNLRGPSFTVQCACSTSLVAVHVACQSLLDYQCDMALAGGCTIDLPQNIGYFFQEGGISSPDGHCRAFDADAKGTVGGNGAGAVLLKRLGDALEDGDHIYAVIRGSAVTNDGAVKIGYTAPSVKGQVAAIAMAQAAAGVHPDQISYIEAHGTGTSLGDPIEIAALKEVFRAKTARRGYCAIGSVKTNIGHLDTAAGVTGLIKSALALERELIPASLHYQAPNPKIDFANSPFFVNAALRPWPRNGEPRFAGVSSFGMGGTNAHVVLEEAPRRSKSPSRRPWHLVVLSAKSEQALDAAAARLSHHLRRNESLDMSDVAYTSQVGRRAFDHRRALVTCSPEDAAGELVGQARPANGYSGVRLAEARSVAFMFPGQGAQYANMGRELYDVEPVFREEVDRCSAILEPLLGFDLREVLFPDESRAAEAEETLRSTAVTQPALFTLEHSLARLLMSWGIKPAAMIGHSIGEYVAAELAGVFTLEEALAIVAERGRLMQALPQGAMLAVMAEQDQVAGRLGDGVSIAAVNAPGECVVSGSTAEIDALEVGFKAEGIACQRLRTSHAFHSPMMDPILGEFRERLRELTLGAPQIPFVSNLTGEWLRPGEAVDPDYWMRHLRHPVRFADGVRRLLQEPAFVLLEVGPGHTLASLAARHPDKAPGQPAFSTLPSRGSADSDSRSLLSAVGGMWVNGVEIDWRAMWRDEARQRVVLPTYPFARERHWVDGGPMGGGQAGGAPQAGVGMQPGRGSSGDLGDWFYVPGWARTPLPRASGYGSELAYWLVFADGQGVGARLAARLKADGQDVTVVSPGYGYLHIDEQTIVIDPAKREDYVRLLQELAEVGRTPTHVVHFWGANQGEEPSLDPQHADWVLNRGFYSLVSLMQAVGELPALPRLRIAVVTSHLHSITGQERVQPLKATVLGPVKVIPQEYPGVEVRSIDVVVPPDQDGQDRLAEQLLVECLGEAREPLVAYRENMRLVQQYAPVRLNPPPREAMRLRDNGAYLVTGGLGGIGLVLAEHLARTVKARLALTARTEMPPREEWDELLAGSDGGDGPADKIRAVRKLEELGAEVLVLRADVADLGEMSAALAETVDRFGSLNGVIHAAGVAGGGIVQLKTRAEAERVMRPKVMGTLVLNQLLADVPIDFLALQSSLAAIFGGAGQVDYCAANAFLDGYALAVAGKTPPTVSINWEHWLEVGMAVNTEAPEEVRRGRDAGPWRGIRPAEGAEAFSRVLSETWPQVVVSTFDFRGLWLQLGAPAQEVAATAGKAPTHERSESMKPYVPPENAIQAAVAGLLEDLLGVHPVGSSDNFFELGGHSLLAVQLVSRLRDTFHVELPIRSIFDAPSVADLALAVQAMQTGAPQGAGAAPRSDGQEAEPVQELEEGEI